MPSAERIRALVATLGGVMVMAAAARADDANDYPTSARAEYVFGCMKANGEARQTIEQCSCSIDVIASLLPYDRYVTAETVLSMSQVRGNLGTQFRSSEQAKGALDDLRRAQAEAEVQVLLGTHRKRGGHPDSLTAQRQLPELSTFHCFWKGWPDVSLASARKVFAPFET